MAAALGWARVSATFTDAISMTPSLNAQDVAPSALTFFFEATPVVSALQPEGFEGSAYAGVLLSQYAAYFRPRLVAAKKEGIGHADTPGTSALMPTAATAADEPPARQCPPYARADLRRDEAIITTLAQLFIKRPSEWTVH
ncbi:hypothetical protein Ctob_014921 [Chrysochromulina tobinii]|uniref:Uncharacterized protein n=1 Tax=Chrysochromulina tobinii TaxID=1460289 RepID=A0A0M0KAT8_9EUKA|nr:hypothetical protein Ctob_014921 [Chrysochromulina tobinii]|eukprot:KOO35523.1 hypothetical protein Ctob_014921 [Chrysochromulina sp. CCMP291]